jgi:hypothetical protein
MAGRGPAPKPADQRRRRNKETATDELPAEGYEGKYPELPKTYRSLAPPTKKGAPPRAVRLKFFDETRRWYEAWATSPMATMFTAPTWERLLRLARLIDQFERYPDKTLLAEIRLQEATLGGTPADLLRLRKTIAAPEDDRPALAAVSSLAGRRERRAVDPTGG